MIYIKSFYMTVHGLGILGHLTNEAPDVYQDEDWCALYSWTLKTFMARRMKQYKPSRKATFPSSGRQDNARCRLYLYDAPMLMNFLSNLPVRTFSAFSHATNSRYVIFFSRMPRQSFCSAILFKSASTFPGLPVIPHLYPNMDNDRYA